MRDMDRADAISVLNLNPEPADGSWRYAAPTGQLVHMARKSAMRAPRLPSVPSADECNAVVEMFNRLDARQAAARRSLEGKALAEHAARLGCAAPAGVTVVARRAP